MLSQKLAEVMAEVGYVQKDAHNDFSHYDYASLKAVLRKVNPALSKRGIAVSSQAEILSQVRIPGKYGDNNMVTVKISLEFVDGEERIHAEGIGSGLDAGDKGAMKANAAALKYALANAFMISWGDDPEADVSTDNTGPYMAGLEKVPELNPFTGKDMNPIEAPLPPKGTKGINDVRALYGHAEVLGWTTEELLSWVAKRTAGKKPEEVTAAQAKALLAAIKKETS